MNGAIVKADESWGDGDMLVATILVSRWVRRVDENFGGMVESASFKRLCVLP